MTKLGATLLPTSSEEPTVDETHSRKRDSPLQRRAKLGMLFGVWYALNVAYNISNKQVLSVFPKSLLVGWVQLGIGGVYVIIGWALGLRAQPLWRISEAEHIYFSPIAAFHGFGHLATTLAIRVGSVSFTHIVKSMLPLFSALASYLMLGQTFAWPVYASLIPVVAGLSIAAAEDVSFNWLAFTAAMASNMLFAMRSNWSKRVMSTLGEERITASNLYACMTVVAFLLLAPFVVFFGEVDAGLAVAFDRVAGKGDGLLFFLKLITSGLLYYLNNEVMFLALAQVHPVTLAVGNTLKRVLVIGSSSVVFGHSLTPTTIIGCTVGVLGVLSYSVMRERYHR